MATFNEFVTQVKESFKKVASTIFTLKQQQGDLNGLSTTEKQTLVGAINEIVTSMQNGNGLTQTEVSTLIEQKFNTLTSGASAALDTFAEVEAELKKGTDSVASILAEIGKLKLSQTTQEQDIAKLKPLLEGEDADILVMVEKMLTTGVSE